MRLFEGEGKGQPTDLEVLLDQFLKDQVNLTREGQRPARLVPVAILASLLDSMAPDASFRAEAIEVIAAEIEARIAEMDAAKGSEMPGA